MPWTTKPKVMEFRHKSSVLDTAVEVLHGWSRHQSGRNASLLAYYGILSIVPLMLAATTVLGWILSGNDDLRRDISERATDSIPIFGPEIAKNAGSLDGNVVALIIGLLAALWASTRAFVGIQGAQDDTWEIPVPERGNIAMKRGKALLGLFVICASQVAGLVVSSMVGALNLPGPTNILLYAGSWVINMAMVAIIYRVLTAAEISWRTVLPGTILTGTAYTALSVFGRTIVNRLLDSAQDTYGSFATTLALMSWLSLHATIALMGGELNAAIEMRRSRLHSAAR